MPHPHVHIVVKVEGRDGARLPVTRETLREWRLSFAEKMRGQGIEANATLKAARGKFREPQEQHSIFFSARNGKSTVMEAKAIQALRELASGKSAPEPIKEKLIKIRADVLNEWVRAIRQLQAEGHDKLAKDVAKFVVAFEPVKTVLEKMKEKATDEIRGKVQKNRDMEAKQDAQTR